MIQDFLIKNVLKISWYIYRVNGTTRFNLTGINNYNMKLSAFTLKNILHGKIIVPDEEIFELPEKVL